jgi:hypothetical protein
MKPGPRSVQATAGGGTSHPTSQTPFDHTYPFMNSILRDTNELAVVLCAAANAHFREDVLNWAELEGLTHCTFSGDYPQAWVIQFKRGDERSNFIDWLDSARQRAARGLGLIDLARAGLGQTKLSVNDGELRETALTPMAGTTPLALALVFEPSVEIWFPRTHYFPETDLHISDVDEFLAHSPDVATIKKTIMGGLYSEANWREFVAATPSEDVGMFIEMVSGYLKALPASSKEKNRWEDLCSRHRAPAEARTEFRFIGECPPTSLLFGSPQRQLPKLRSSLEMAIQNGDMPADDKKEMLAAVQDGFEPLDILDQDLFRRVYVGADDETVLLIRAAMAAASRAAFEAVGQRENPSESILNLIKEVNASLMIAANSLLRSGQRP